MDPGINIIFIGYYESHMSHGFPYFKSWRNNSYMDFRFIN